MAPRSHWRREKEKVENPAISRALDTLGVPSIPLKLTRGSETGRPDVLFLIPGGKPLFIEFKDGDNKPEPKQEYWIEILTTLGYDVKVCYSTQAALRAIARAVCRARRSEVGATTLHAESCEVVIGTRLRRTVFGPRLKKDIHYARSLQFLKETGCSEQDACGCAVKGVPPRLG